MLTLSRKVGESLRIGADIRVIVRAIRGQQVQISIEAPAEIGVYRSEIYEAIRHANLAAANPKPAASTVAQATSPDGGVGGEVMKKLTTIDTSRFGSIDVPEDSIVEFPEGLVGLHDFRRFVLIDRPNSPMRWMQSMEVPELAFLVADPQMFVTDYRAEVPGTELETLGETNSDELAVGVICTIPENPSEATVNLRAPLVVDIRSRRGKQVVLTDSEYAIHHPWMAQQAAA